jgi:hypothetical protein
MAAVIPTDAPPIGNPIVSTFILGDPDRGPETQGSLDPYSHGGKLAHHNEKELMWWRARIENAVRRHRGPHAVTVETPVVTSFLFIVRRRGPALKAAYRIWPMGIEGDVDKLARAAHDGLGRIHKQDKVGNQTVKYTIGAEVFSDDRKVIGCVAMKTYAQPGDDLGVLCRIWVPDPALERAGWMPVPDWPGWRYVHRDHLLSV